MDNQYKILLVEDDPFDADLIKKYLQRSGIRFDVTIVSDEDEFMRTITGETFDAILSDHKLPHLTSLDVLRVCRNQIKGVPFILVTGTISEEQVVNIIKEGADDYVLKDNIKRLPIAIKNAIINERKLLEKDVARNELIKKTDAERKIIEEKLKAKIFELDAFIYRTAHDLRGPLMSILGLVAIAKKELKDDMTQMFLDKFDKTAVRLDNILNDLISVTKITRGETNFTKIHLDTLIPALIKRLDNKTGIFGVKFDLDLPDRHNFLSDRYLVRSILQNILENSIQYRDYNAENTIIAISAKASADSVQIKISDNGQGIPDDMKDKIFNMFYKGNYASTGTGLGLYIVRVAVEKLGGSISVSSNYVKGTAVTITLPILNNAQVERLLAEQI